MEFKKRVQQLQDEIAVACSRSKDHQVSERSSRTELVLRVAVMLLDEDPENPTAQDPARYIAGKLNSAIGQFDLKVIRIAS